jgi:Ser/Thr protein kinase RdoA (MazF antagonist)
MHTRFVRHPMLVDVRHRGGELGAGFYSANVSDAITCLEAIPLARLEGSGDGVSLRDRLLQRMWALRAEESRRTEAIAELGGPDTLLHGDLWLKNLAVIRDGGAVWVRLFDWDHAGLGPIGYDLSTFLAKFSPDTRARLLELYGETVHAVWELPSRDDLNYLFETFELARLACCVLWAAFAVTDQPDASWPMQELEEADAWLASLEAVLQAT